MILKPKKSCSKNSFWRFLDIMIGYNILWYISFQIHGLLSTNITSSSEIACKKTARLLSKTFSWTFFFTEKDQVLDNREGAIYTEVNKLKSENWRLQDVSHRTCTRLGQALWDTLRDTLYNTHLIEKQVMTKKCHLTLFWTNGCSTTFVKLVL
jgi:hypothetical protein